jgi:outer membrane lipoprotein-sorting protein
MNLKLFSLSIFLLSAPSLFAAGPAQSKVDALVKRSEDQVRGTSLKADVTMKVVNDSDERSLSFKIWTQGSDKATIKITRPAKDRNAGNLRLKLQLWQFLPNVDRLITIPPSMMLQSWMGSDFTNDDLVKTSSISKDYTHKYLGEEMVGAYKAYKIECEPNPTAPVVWGKVVEWLRVPDAVPLKQEFYAERGELVKVMLGTDIKKLGKHTVPTTLTMINQKKNGAKTILHYDKISYDGTIDPSIFRQEFLRKPVQD